MSKFTIERARFLATVRRHERALTQGYGNRPGAERGYRQPGRKLKMRTGAEQVEAEQYGVHNRREYQRAREREARAMEACYAQMHDEAEAQGRYIEPDEDEVWHPVQRGLDRLNARDRKAVERALLLQEIGFNPISMNGVIAEGFILHMRPRARRVFLAHLSAHNVAEAMEWDRKTWANAR